MSGEPTSSSPDEMQSQGGSLIVGANSAQAVAKLEEVQTLVPVANKGGITELPLSETLREIRQINNQTAMLLLCSHATKLELDLQAAKKEKDAAIQKSEKWMQDYYGEEKKCAVLRSELRGVSSKKNLQKFVGTMGGLIAGAAIPFAIVEATRGWGLAGSMIGIALLVAGFWPSESKET